MREVWFHKTAVHNKRVYLAGEYYTLPQVDALLLVSSGCACYADDNQPDEGALQHDNSSSYSRSG